MNNTAEYKRLDFSKLNLDPTPFSTEESLRDITPIEWSKEVLDNDGGYTIRVNIPVITSKKLKRTPSSKENIERNKFLDTHEFSFDVKENGEVSVNVSDKKYKNKSDDKSEIIEMNELWNELVKISEETTNHFHSYKYFLSQQKTINNTD